MATRWFKRPDGDALVLRKSPRLASWNKATDPDQVRLREYLDDTRDMLGPLPMSRPWTLRLDVGLAPGRDLVDMADLDNYAFPLAVHLRNEHLVSVWCTKAHANTSTIRVEPAREVSEPAGVIAVRTIASAQSRMYKQQVREGVLVGGEIPGGAVWMQISFAVGPRRNWLNLWKPTIDALDPLLGRTRQDRDWHPRDGRIIDLGMHVTDDPSLGNDVVVSIAAGQVDEAGLAP